MQVRWSLDTTAAAQVACGGRDPHGGVLQTSRAQTAVRGKAVLGMTDQLGWLPHLDVQAVEEAC